MTDVLALDLATTAPKCDRYVYALYAGQQLLPCYIGIGRAGRMHQHLQFARSGNLSRGNLRKCRTLRACCLRGVQILACTLATRLTIDEACNLERLLIAIYGRRDLKTGCLLNAAGGGSVGMRAFSPTTKARLAEAGRRHMARPEIRQMLNERKNTPEARARQAAAVTGKIPSDEARAKMSASCRERNARDQENWQRFLASRTPGAFRGGNHSVKAKAKISEAAKKQWTDPVIRAKRSAFFNDPDVQARIAPTRFGRRTMLGKKHSAETRRKMSIAQKTRRENERTGVSP